MNSNPMLCDSSVLYWKHLSSVTLSCNICKSDSYLQTINKSFSFSSHHLGRSKPAAVFVPGSPEDDEEEEEEPDPDQMNIDGSPLQPLLCVLFVHL